MRKVGVVNIAPVKFLGVGGLAVAVASDEANNGSGNVDEWKRKRLLGVGADFVVPDYRDVISLVDYVLEA